MKRALPWTFEESRGNLNAGEVTDAEGYTVARIDGYPEDGRLMAAAPDLLEALRFIVEDAQPGEDARLTVEGYNRACEAIQKATGN